MIRSLLAAGIVWALAPLSVSGQSQASAEDPGDVEADAGFFFGEGKALVTGDISEDEAIRSSKEAARRRVIEEALGVQLQSTSIIENYLAAVNFIVGSAQGITRDETWEIERSIRSGTFLVTAKLRARVEPVSGKEAPTVKVNMPEQRRLLAGDPFAFSVETGIDAYVGIYNRDGDDRVVRLYPLDSEEPYQLGADERLELPPPGLIMATEPRADRDEDLEMIIVVASAKPFKASWLSEGAAGETADQSIEAAVPYSRFLDALAKQDLAYVNVVYEPILVERPE